MSLIHESILDKQICLTLNASWSAVGFRTVRSSVIAMMSESNGEPPMLALDMELDEAGQITYANPVAWDAWQDLPVRPSDFYIQTKDSKIRAPLVVITRFYNKVPMKRPRLSSGTIYERDQGVCQYTGRKLPRRDLNLDHVVPRARGGRDTFENIVLADKRINTLKGDRLNHEIGLKLIRQPKAPPALPATAMLREARHPTHRPFLIHKD